jgi:hypothetical protein
MGVKYIYADAWSAPGYMKTNDDYVRKLAKMQTGESLTEKLVHLGRWWLSMWGDRRDMLIRGLETGLRKLLSGIYRTL